MQKVNEILVKLLNISLMSRTLLFIGAIADHFVPTFYLQNSTLMVKFVVTQEIQRIIQKYNERQHQSIGNEKYIDPEALAIEHLLLVQIAATLQASEDDSATKLQYSLNNILKSTSLYIAPIQKPKPVVPFC